MVENVEKDPYKVALQDLVTAAGVYSMIFGPKRHVLRRQLDYALDNARKLLKESTNG